MPLGFKVCGSVAGPPRLCVGSILLVPTVVALPIDVRSCEGYRGHGVHQALWYPSVEFRIEARDADDLICPVAPTDDLVGGAFRLGEVHD